MKKEMGIERKKEKIFGDKFFKSLLIIFFVFILINVSDTIYLNKFSENNNNNNNKINSGFNEKVLGNVFLVGVGGADISPASISGPVLLDFYADWCGPCKSMNPIVDALIKAGYNVVRVDCTNQGQNNALKIKYGITNLPTFVVVDSSGKFNKLVGPTSKETLESMIKAAIAASTPVTPPVTTPTNPVNPTPTPTPTQPVTVNPNPPVGNRVQLTDLPKVNTPLTVPITTKIDKTNACEYAAGKTTVKFNCGYVIIDGKYTWCDGNGGMTDCPPCNRCQNYKNNNPSCSVQGEPGICVADVTAIKKNFLFSYDNTNNNLNVLGSASLFAAGAAVAQNVQSNLLSASVKIKVSDPAGADWGSGTIVGQNGNNYIILTCGHVFRQYLKSGGSITVILNGNNNGKQVTGTYISSDINNEVGLISISITGLNPVVVAPISSIGVNPQDTLYITGYPGGGNYIQTIAGVISITRGSSTTTNKQLELDKPVAGGNSGGGIFNSNGQVVGIAWGSDGKTTFGTELPAIQDALNKNNLAAIINNPQPSPTQPVTATPSPAIANNNNNKNIILTPVQNPNPNCKIDIKTSTSNDGCCQYAVDANGKQTGVGSCGKCEVQSSCPTTDTNADPNIKQSCDDKVKEKCGTETNPIGSDGKEIKCVLVNGNFAKTNNFNVKIFTDNIQQFPNVDYCVYAKSLEYNRCKQAVDWTGSNLGADSGHPNGQNWNNIIDINNIDKYKNILPVNIQNSWNQLSQDQKLNAYYNVFANNPLLAAKYPSISYILKIPDWARPPKNSNWEISASYITIKLTTSVGIGGETGMNFDKGEVGGWVMSIQGNEEGLKSATIPHEVLHMVTGSNFRAPLARWLDEGMSTSVESSKEKCIREVTMLLDLTSKGYYVSPNDLVSTMIYPKNINNMLMFYAQGSMYVEYLIKQGGGDCAGKQKLYSFVNDMHAKINACLGPFFTGDENSYNTPQYKNCVISATQSVLSADYGTSIDALNRDSFNNIIDNLKSGNNPCCTKFNVQQNQKTLSITDGKGGSWNIKLG